MILHLFDDEKVVNRTIKSFELALGKKSIYLCFARGNLKYVKEHERLFIYSDKLIPNLRKFDISCIIIHYLSQEKINFVRKYFPLNIKIYWMMWGADFYNELLYSAGYPMYYRFPILGWKPLIKRILHFVGIDYNRKHRLDTLHFIENNIDVCVTTPIEYKLCKKYYENIFSKLDYVDSFFYYPIDEILSDNLLNSSVEGDIILVGNSPSITNNHIYAFKYLKKLNLNDKRIITPLSYGGMQSYKKYVINKGRKFFGDRYEALLDFLPLDDYNELLLHASVCVFPSWRQEGNGNIIIALYLGAKVFISYHSPLYIYYRNMGIKLFELEEITNEELRNPLSIEDQVKNREILINNFSLEKQIESIRNIWGVY